MNKAVINNETRSYNELQEELLARGNRLHTEAIQQAIFFLPKELGKSISKLFGGSDMGAYPAKQ